MNEERAAEFRRIVAAVLGRFFAQNGATVPKAAEADVFAARLCALVAERGLPRPIDDGEAGQPGGMSETECAPLVARIVASACDPLLQEAARQLVKACFYPEFRNCRDSFREVSSDGACRRQELARARRRVSGAHCVDCPHWTALEPAQHSHYLGCEWRGNVAEWQAHRDVFLPEDFRALRRWLHAEARRQRAPRPPLTP